MAKAQPKYRLTIDWMPTDEDYLFVEVHRPDITRKHLEQIIKEFRAYWMNRLDAKGEKRAQDWKATWRNRIMSVIVRPSYAQRPQHQQPQARTRTQMTSSALDRICFGRKQDDGIIDIN